MLAWHPSWTRGGMKRLLSVGTASGITASLMGLSLCDRRGMREVLVVLTSRKGQGGSDRTPSWPVTSKNSEQTLFSNSGGDEKGEVTTAKVVFLARTSLFPSGMECSFLRYSTSVIMLGLVLLVNNAPAGFETISEGVDSASCSSSQYILPTSLQTSPKPNSSLWFSYSSSETISLCSISYPNTGPFLKLLDDSDPSRKPGGGRFPFPGACIFTGPDGVRVEGGMEYPNTTGGDSSVMRPGVILAQAFFGGVSTVG